METPNYRKASIYFDDETVLEVEQRGGGGSGVGGDTGLSAVNLITGESTNDALAEKDETIEEQAATIEQQAGTIETQAATISDLEDEVAAKQAIIDAFPTIEALSVTANGTYSETGKVYSPVNVNVPDTGLKLINGKFKFINNLSQEVFISFPLYNPTRKCTTVTSYKVAANGNYDVPCDIAIAASDANPSILVGVDVDPSLYTVSASPSTQSGTTTMTASIIAFRRVIEINFTPNDGTIVGKIGDITITPIT